MRKHRKPGPATVNPGSIAQKIFPIGAMLTVMAWPGLAPGQTIVEPPPVESFALGSGQNSEADDDAVTDLYRELIDGTSNSTTSPSVTGTPPLPPSAQVNSQAVHQTPVENSSISGTLPSSTNSGIVNDPFQAIAGSTNSVSSPLSPPPDSASPFAPASSETGQSESVPLGQGAALPQPDWQDVSNKAPQPQSRYYSNAPEPQFDAGQGRWIQMEVGQADSAGSVPAVSGPRPSSVATVHTSPSEQLDAIMDDVAQTPATVQGQIATPGATSVHTPEGRERLRLLFPDMMASDSQQAPASSPATGSVAPPVPDFSGLAAQSPASTGGQSGQIEDYAGSSAILRAGGLLTQEDHYGGAEILPPLTGQPPLKVPVTPVESPVKQPEVQPQPPKSAVAAPAAPESTSPKKSRSAKASGSKRVKSNAKTRATAPAASANLMIINETGNPRVGEIYKSVLGRMGHKVVSVAEGAPVGAPGQTVINYRPGYRAQAQSVSRHLPGKKVLSEAKGGQVLASEVMVYIR